MSTPLSHLLLAAALLAGCGRSLTPGADGTPSGTAGATGTTTAQCSAAAIGQPTYAGFAAAFFAGYCTRCHSSALVGPARNGAPPGHDFDTLAGARQQATHIDLTAAASPTGTVTNTAMPPDAPLPALDDRKRLACWIAGGTPAAARVASIAHAP